MDGHEGRPAMQRSLMMVLASRLAVSTGLLFTSQCSSVVTANSSCIYGSLSSFLACVPMRVFAAALNVFVSSLRQIQAQFRGTLLLVFVSEL